MSILRAPRVVLVFLTLSPFLSLSRTHGDEPRFDRVVIDADFPGAYQVEVADVNGDGKPDLVAVGGGTCAWYENPSWTKRVVTGPDRTPDIISSATADLDGDGKAEVAIAYDFAMNVPKRGKLLLAVQGATSDAPWEVRPVADVPSIHRLRWGPVLRPGRLDLVVAPIFGPNAAPPTYDQDPARLRIYRTGGDPGDVTGWAAIDAPGGFVLHAIEVRADPAPKDAPAILVANNLGVFGDAPRGEGTFASFPVIPTPPGVPPRRGCSEVHLGRFAAGGRFLATVEPWHGSQVAIRPRLDDPPGSETKPRFGDRVVLDGTLDDGHALWVADIDGDGGDEVFAGHRGEDHRVSVYKHDGKAWARTVLDRDIAAQDLRGGDLDGDGTPDVVAVGGSTHNVVWYRPRKP